MTLDLTFDITVITQVQALLCEMRQNSNVQQSTAHTKLFQLFESIASYAIEMINVERKTRTACHSIHFQSNFTIN